MSPRSDNSLYGGGCDGFDTSNHFDSSASRRDSDLALQQKLGIWPKRRRRANPDNRSDPPFAEGHLSES